MSRTIQRWAPWMMGPSVPPPFRKQLTCFRSLSSQKAFSLLRRPRLSQLPSGNNFYSTESTKDSIPADREHHPQLTRLLDHVSTLTPCKGLDPHSYTSGRWLRRDKLERDSRYISFDFDALCRRVIELCPGAASITSYDKKEGGYNRVFIFTTDNAQRIVARLPFALAGPARLTTNSEVATIKYLQSNTSIPIPHILDWSDDASSNAIGSEYIIMAHAAGVQLHQRWPTMAGDQKIRCINAICEKMKEMVDIEFSAYGSLYSVDALSDDSSKMILTDRQFCIGPHCSSIYWNCAPGESRYYHNVKPNRGPWPNLTTYTNALVDVGISRIPAFDSDSHVRLFYHGSIQTHLTLLSSGRGVITQMSKVSRIQNAATPILFHPDLHKRNIFVSDDEPAVITDIIDWQSSSIEPAFWYADEIPDFAQPIAHRSDENELEPDRERCAKAFDVCTRFLVPRLAGPRLMDESLFRPFRYCYRTWKDGAVAFRHELIETQKAWKELGFMGPCPLPVPTLEQVASHQKEYRMFEAAHQLRSDLSGLLNTASDGWVPSEDWEATEAVHREMFDGMLQAVLTNADPDNNEPIRTEADLRAIWPFDI